MFSKVLVSDDLDSINSGVANTLSSLGVQVVDKVQYCDDAYLKIKSAALKKYPFELLITDLSYVPDHREQNFNSGEELIAIIKKEHPEVKIIVYSVEDRKQRVANIMNELKADAYVCKGRIGLKELEQAITSVYNGQTYLSTQLQHLLHKSSHSEIDDFDIELVRLLSLGHSQEEISTIFKNQDVSPSSLSSIEKRLNRLKIQFKANNAIHLVSIVKDLGLI
ncbi:MAG: response regulator [Flavobacteriaceae bacterium]|nr:response regulator [Flavobacteriaceae bacterium]|tara:strand:+ start:3074 stop:3739 length:666 start_codon:yes stop_codon:yes gene_type:complete